MLAPINRSEGNNRYLDGENSQKNQRTQRLIVYTCIVVTSAIFLGYSLLTNREHVAPAAGLFSATVLGTTGIECLQRSLVKQKDLWNK